MSDLVVKALYSFRCWHFWRNSFYYFFPGTGRQQRVCYQCDKSKVQPHMDNDYEFNYVWRSTGKWDARTIKMAEEYDRHE